MVVAGAMKDLADINKKFADDVGEIAERVKSKNTKD
jgi:hypothetical protein